MEFWNDVTTDKGWQVLLKLRKELDFILIGGWACYLYTKSIKSKDIDIIIDFETLDKMKRDYNIKKTDFLKKYEAKADGISVDIYVPFYSKLAVPIGEIENNCSSLEGFELPKPEMLLILKQHAEMERPHSVKGEKDRVDILNLMMKSNLNKQLYIDLCKQNALAGYPDRLKSIIRTAKKEFEYLGIRDLRKRKLLKKKLEIGL